MAVDRTRNGWLYHTIEEAQEALEVVKSDVRGDFGDEAVEDGYSELVLGVALRCTPTVARELRRREGIPEDRGWER